MKQIVLYLFILLATGLLPCCKQNSGNKESNRSVDSLQSEAIVPDSLEIIDKNRLLNDDLLLELIPSSIFVFNDSVHFSYKITNTASKDLMLYCIQSLGIKLEPLADSNPVWPGCFLYIIDKNNKLPTELWVTLGGKYEELPKEYEIYSYVKLDVNESLTFNRRFDIKCLRLDSGEYKLKLRYSSPHNEEFINRFKKEQRLKTKLKDYELFEGVVESNMCPFYYRKVES
jgi:hypothetical protein